MGLLARFRAWWRRRLGSGDADAGGSPGYECAVCGTGVDDPEGRCPLCRSTDVVAAAPGSATGDGDEGDGGAVGRRVVAGEDAAIDRLRELRADEALLERYADRWHRVEGGFRVETDRGTRTVDTREEVLALLRAEDG